MVEVKITLSKLLDFLKRFESGEVTKEALKGVKKALERSFKENVLNQPHVGGVYEIHNKEELKSRIKAGKTKGHNPTKAKVAKYSKNYLDRKPSGLGPHVLSGNFVKATTITLSGDSVIMKTDGSNLVNSSGDSYAIRHESTKSVLKATFLLGWHDIMYEIQQKLIKELR